MARAASAAPSRRLAANPAVAAAFPFEAVVVGSLIPAGQPGLDSRPRLTAWRPRCRVQRCAVRWPQVALRRLASMYPAMECHPAAGRPGIASALRDDRGQFDVFPDAFAETRAIPPGLKA